METPVERIKGLINCLPIKDIAYATKFIEKRDFESLRDLVQSSITITKNKMKGKSKIEKDMAVLDMEILYSEVAEYCALLGCDLPTSYDDSYEDCEPEDEDININYEF